MRPSAPISEKRAGAWGWNCVLAISTAQKDFLFFLDRVLPRARALAGNRPLLITLDGAHDAAANREYLAREQIDYLIKWNPRKENPNDWKVRAEAEGRFVEVRPGKRVALFDEVVEWSFGERSHRSRRVVQLVERTEDRRGQPLLIPDLVLEGWWTSLDAGSVDAEPGDSPLSGAARSRRRGRCAVARTGRAGAGSAPTSPGGGLVAQRASEPILPQLVGPVMHRPVAWNIQSPLARAAHAAFSSPRGWR